MKALMWVSGLVSATAIEWVARADMGCDVGCTTQNAPVSPLGLAAIFIGLAVVGFRLSRRG